MSRWLVAASFVVVSACAHRPPPKQPDVRARPPAPLPSTVSYNAGTAALEQNDPVGAARIFAAIPQSSPDYALAQKALAATLPEVVAVTQSWLKTIDRNVKQEHFVAAKKRLEYMLDFFTLDDATRSAIENKLQEVDQNALVERVNLEELDKQTLPLMQSGDLSGALKVMRRAFSVARDVAPDSMLDRERRIAAVEQRLGSAKTSESAMAAAPTREAAKPSRSKRGKKNEPAPGPATPTPVAVLTPEEQPEAEPAPSDAATRVRDMVEQAQAFQENRAYFNAVVGWMRVRAADPGNDQAIRALAQLEPKRQELVQEYLESANRYFQQQDLESAVPYFRRVLALDPNNEQAKKGLEMHYNLERIRREKNRR